MSDNLTDSNVEEDIITRHRKEKKELQAKIQALKKTATKGDKKKRKEVLEEIAKLESDLVSKHASELETAQASTVECVEAVTQDIEAIALEPESKVSKAQKRRNKKEQANKEREQRIIEQDAENENSLRNIETQKIKKKLEEKGLMIFEIPSDGDCLYAAIDHGLRELGIVEFNPRYLRHLTAAYIRKNPNDFLPFLCDPSTGDPLSEEKFLEYCDKIATTCQWGGQVELGALAEVTKKALVIVQADGPDLVMGEQFKDTGRVLLTYHRHIYRLGEHYNSVQPFVVQTDDLE